MDFIMTDGWAIIVVLAAVCGLVYSYTLRTCGSSDSDELDYLTSLNISVEAKNGCKTDYDCNFIINNRFTKYEMLLDYETCINQTCVSFFDKCNQTAQTDYGFENPHCNSWGDYKCTCYDYKIISPRKEIKQNNSVQIIPEKAEKVATVTFRLNKDAIEVNDG